jgi:hypothetical protein
MWQNIIGIFFSKIDKFFFPKKRGINNVTNFFFQPPFFLWCLTHFAPKQKKAYTNIFILPKKKKKKKKKKLHG